MAVFAATDYQITVNSVDLSDHIAAVDLPIEADEQEDTAFGDTWRSRLGGLKDASITISWHQDFAASEVDATLWPLLGTVTEVVVKPTSGTVTTTNPSYTASFLVSKYTPIAGSVGDLATLDTTWPVSGAVVRDDGS
jgi:hypothetical protein